MHFCLLVVFDIAVCIFSDYNSCRQLDIEFMLRKTLRQELMILEGIARASQHALPDDDVAEPLLHTHEQDIYTLEQILSWGNGNHSEVSPKERKRREKWRRAREKGRLMAQELHEEIEEAKPLPKEERPPLPINQYFQRLKKMPGLGVQEDIITDTT